MNEPGKNKHEDTDEIGTGLETGNEVNIAIEQQGDDAAAGILRDVDAAKHGQKPDDAANNEAESAAGQPRDA